MFVDIRGYGRLVEELGDATTLKILRAYARIVKGCLPERGVVAEQVGDSFYLVFRSPVDAVRSAIAIVDKAREHTARHPDLPLRPAIGIEAGQTLPHGGGNAGAAPVRANRITRKARPGQVLIGDAVAALIGPAKIPLRDVGATRLADGQSVHLYEVHAPYPDDAQTRVERSLVTVLFTDIVDSTASAVRRGQDGWKELFERHHVIVREGLRRYGGVEVDTAGDGFYATMDTPSRAIDCAIAIRDRIKSEIGIDIRAGIHVGEAESVAGKFGGISVVVGGRIKDLAGAGEILVSQAVKDVVLGSPTTFVEHARVGLKGVPDQWTVYRVVP